MENTIQQTDEIEIDLVELFMVLLRHAALIISVGIMTALIAYLWTQLMISPVYQSTTKIVILNKQNQTNVTYSDIQLGTQLTKDYAELIQSRYVLEEVIQQLDLDMSYKKLAGNVSVTTPSDARILAITVADTDPVRAMKIANTIREVSSIHILNVMDIQAVNIAETANMPTAKSSPGTFKNVMIGGMLGAFLVAAVVVLRHLLDDTIKTPDDVERYLQLSTLALIPVNEGEQGSKKKRKKSSRRR